MIGPIPRTVMKRRAPFVLARFRTGLLLQCVDLRIESCDPSEQKANGQRDGIGQASSAPQSLQARVSDGPDPHYSHTGQRLLNISRAIIIRSRLINTHKQYTGVILKL